MGLRLRAILDGDGTGFAAMMNRANAATKKFSGDFGGLKSTIAGVFTVGAIAGFARKVINVADHLNDLSLRLGVNVEWLQETGFAAKQAGADVDKLTKFLEKLGENREAALQGGETGRTKLAAFERFGISEQTLRSSNLQQLFDRVAKAYKDGSQQALGPALKEVGGKSAYELAASFQAGIEENRHLAREAGAVISEEHIMVLENLGDRLTTLGEVLVAAFAPAIVFVTGVVETAVNKIKQIGAFLGGFSEGFRSSTYTSGAFGLIKDIKSGFETGTDTAAEEINRQEKATSASDEARAKARAARRAREQAPVEVEELINRDRAAKTKSAGALKGPGLVTDSLVGVGNFLGRNPALVNNVANQQLMVAREQLAVSKDMHKAILNLNGSGLGIFNLFSGIPPG